MLHFYPYGSKNIEDVVVFNQYKCLDPKEFKNNSQLEEFVVDDYFPTVFKDNTNLMNFQPVLFCHDQEPLHFDLYQDDLISNDVKQKIFNEEGFYPKNLNLKYSLPISFQKQWILLHSELNSTELEKYESTKQFIGAYWWSHAILSLDWYRYAKHDKKLNSSSKSKKIFLIYLRDSSGSRSYRKLFLSLLQKEKTFDSCQIGSFFDTQHVDSNSSATYNAYDMVNTDLSVVLETVADTRIHLTEKTLRCLACGHPFMLVAGPKSLDYLKRYGFKTFSPYINEDYDKEVDLQKRLNMVVNEMQRIHELEDTKRQFIINKCKEIADHNKRIFFSDLFFEKIVQELQDNVENAFQKVCLDLDWQAIWRVRQGQVVVNPECKNTYRWQVQRKILTPLTRHLKKGGTLEDYVPPDLD